MTSNSLNIFRNRATGEGPIPIASTNQAINLGASAITAPLCSSKYFICHNDMVIRLGSLVNDSTEGGNFRLIKHWWELNNKVNKIEKDESTPVTGDAEDLLDWFPCIYFFGINPGVADGFPVDFSVKVHSMVYWKDPLG